MAHQRFLRKQNIYHFHAGVAELADAPDLGSGAARRGGSSPFTRTFKLLKKVLTKWSILDTIVFVASNAVVAEWQTR
jgi:hypothetical protein